MAEIQLYGRIILTCNIEAVTGLHIGGNGAALEIGGLDNPVIRHAVSREPYIPGSSLRGKMRSLLEKKQGSMQNKRVAKATIHCCQGENAKNPCKVCRIFGIPADDSYGSPTRLLVRDIPMTRESEAKLKSARTDQLYTEIKSENAIDRVTSAAAPRNIERVPAGTVFGPAELVFSLYDPADADLFPTLVECLQLVEDDYLGGGGSRGNGKVRFTGIHVDGRSSSHYSTLQELAVYPDLAAMEKDLEPLKEKIQTLIQEK